MASSILIVEDDLVFSTMMKTWLTKKGFEVDTASTNARARKLLAEHRYDLILSDLRLPDQDGIHLLAWLRNRSCHTPLIIMTSYAEIQSAVEAMKQGASDYIAKPVQPDELLKKIKEAVENAEAPAAPGSEKTAPPVTQNFLEGESEAAHQLFNYVRLVAPTQMSVLINGASGTGKEYVAHRIHELSKRNGKPFIAIDCGSIPKDLAASEFFGHVKGSFTGALTDKAGAFEEANGGTLFLDEIGNLSYEVQIQLLRALQERRIRRIGSTKEIEVDVRLICATNENLKEGIAKGTFREDLYHRINEFTLRMPDLKERREDILLFANFFLDQANRELERNLTGFDAGGKRSTPTLSVARQPAPAEKRSKTCHTAGTRQLHHSTGTGGRHTESAGRNQRHTIQPAQWGTGKTAHPARPATYRKQQKQGGTTAGHRPENVIQQNETV